MKILEKGRENVPFKMRGWFLSCEKLDRKKILELRNRLRRKNFLSRRWLT